MHDILLVDDQQNPRKALSILLKKNGYNVREAHDGESAFEKMRNHFFDLVITDLKMEPIDGMQLLKEVKNRYSTTEVIVITAYGTIESGVEAMKYGAYDYITKPFNNDEFLLLVKRALEKKEAIQQAKHWQREFNNRYNFKNVIGNAPLMHQVLKLVSQVAATESTVLISGESGTGKELIAKAIHANSMRRHKPMITINCGSLPENLMESELFGHVKGAFTGAIRDKKGMFQEADMGTAFLDEVAEIVPQTQVKLLRFLQEGEIRRIGDNHSTKVDVRLIAATNKDLEEEIQKGNFRDDLYYRLNVIPIRLPALRERKEDIPILINHFTQKYAQKLNRPVPRFSAAALAILEDYHWPGNVRELENFIERIATLTNKNIIELDDLSFNHSNPFRDVIQRRRNNKGQTLAEMEKSVILETLESCQGNQRKTAQLLGISTTTMWRKLKHYGVDLQNIKAN
ncbi:sigma-54-dependent Fis family transcriptional regulator [candidate division KSB1 bacterium]|nr:sigma-54-dependent Fis family transcriptional regulator [candidate division KSB1 bacterium]